MFSTRLWSLIQKEFIQILRDPRTLVITFALPVVQLLLLGFAATNDVRNVALAVWDVVLASLWRAIEVAAIVAAIVAVGAGLAGRRRQV